MMKSLLILVCMIGACFAISAKFCTDINLGGTCVTMGITLNQSLHAPFYESISSLEVLDPGTIVVIARHYAFFPYNDPWLFIYTGEPVNELFSYNLNDEIRALMVSDVMAGVPLPPSITLYSDINYSGVSVVTAGQQNSSTTFAVFDMGHFPNDAMSSFVIQPYTKALFYNNDNQNSLCWTYSNAISTVWPVTYDPNSMPSCMNDHLSSIDVRYCPVYNC